MEILNPLGVQSIACNVYLVPRFVFTANYKGVLYNCLYKFPGEL